MIVADCEYIRALQTCMVACVEGLQVAAIESDMSVVNIFVPSTGNLYIITSDLMKKMKNSAIDENTGHFDNEIDMADLEGLESTEVGNIMLLVDCSVFTDGPDVIVLNSGRLLAHISHLQKLIV